jgi:hypothetical protein
MVCSFSLGDRERSKGKLCSCRLSLSLVRFPFSFSLSRFRYVSPICVVLPFPSLSFCLALFFFFFLCFVFCFFLRWLEGWFFLRCGFEENDCVVLIRFDFLPYVFSMVNRRRLRLFSLRLQCLSMFFFVASCLILLASRLVSGFAERMLLTWFVRAFLFPAQFSSISYLFFINL